MSRYFFLLCLLLLPKVGYGVSNRLKLIGTLTRLSTRDPSLLANPPNLRSCKKTYFRARKFLVCDAFCVAALLFATVLERSRRRPMWIFNPRFRPCQAMRPYSNNSKLCGIDSFLRRWIIFPEMFPFDWLPEGLSQHRSSQITVAP